MFSSSAAPAAPIPAHRFNWKGASSGDPVISYCLKNSTPRERCVDELIAATMKLEVAAPRMGAIDELQFFEMFLKATNARRAIEVGVLTGVGTMMIARGLPDDGKRCVAVAKGTLLPGARSRHVRFIKQADTHSHWKAAGVDHKIDLRIADAVNTLESLLADGGAGTYDFIFIDVPKNLYDACYELALQLIRPNGVIALDNVLWGGRVLDESVQDVATTCMRAIAEKISADRRVESIMTTQGDGVLWVRKK